jgi:hypothetical protein
MSIEIAQKYGVGVTYKGEDGGLYFKDEAGNVTNLTQPDQLVKVSSNDTTAGYLEGKLVAGTNITLTTNSEGANETITIDAAGGGGGGPETTIIEPSFALVNSTTTPTILAEVTGLEIGSWHKVEAGAYIDPDYNDGYQKSRMGFLDANNNGVGYPKGWAAAYNTAKGIVSPDGVEIHNYIAGAANAVAQSGGFNFYFNADYAASYPFFQFYYKPSTFAQQTLKFAARAAASGSFYVSEVIFSVTKLVTV